MHLSKSQCKINESETGSQLQSHINILCDAFFYLILLFFFIPSFCSVVFFFFFFCLFFLHNVVLTSEEGSPDTDK